MTLRSGSGSWVDREERAAEQEERVDDEAEDGAESDVVLLGGGERDQAGAKASPMRIVNGIDRTASGELRNAEESEHDEEDGRQ